MVGNCTGVTQSVKESTSSLAHTQCLLPSISPLDHSPCRVASPTTAPAVASICCLLRATPSYISKYKCSWIMLRTTLCFFSCRCLLRMDNVSLDIRMMNSLDLKNNKLLPRNSKRQHLFGLHATPISVSQPICSIHIQHQGNTQIRQGS